MTSTISNSRCYLSDPHSKREYTSKLFAEIAPRYDFITHALSFGQDKRWKADLVSLLPGIDAPRCLDIGCGTGDIAFLLAERNKAGILIETLVDLEAKKSVGIPDSILAQAIPTAAAAQAS